MNNSVKERLTDKAYEIINLPKLEFEFGELEFLTKDTIDAAQAGYRYDEATKEANPKWPGEEYIIIGLDSSAGLDEDLLVVNTKEPALPVYLIDTEGEWNAPVKICEGLVQLNQIVNVLEKYASAFASSTLSNEAYDEAYEKIFDIVGSVEKCAYWETLLNNARPTEDEEESDNNKSIEAL